MPEPFAPARPAAPHADAPDPEFWGPPRLPRPGRRARGSAHSGGAAFDRLADRFHDRIHDWRADPRAGVVLLIVIAVVAGVVWYRVGVGPGSGAAAGEPEIRAEPEPATEPAAGSGPTSTSTPDGEVTVHVAGAVVHPGVIELPAGSRVIDAVEATGGGVPEADLDRMNLAAPLVDGQRVLVQRIGDPPLPTDPNATTNGGTGAPGAPTSELINLNTATAAQLETLPGIGPVLAEAIITERDRRGGFRSVNELRDVRGIGDQRFADIEALVTV